jgi:hypothetical protein
MPLRILSERVQDTASQKPDKIYYIYVRIFVKDDTPNAGPAGLDNIECVIYKLDPSFKKNRLRRSEKRDSNFEIKIWTYGWFSISATVIPKSGPPFEIYGYVQFDPTDEERDANGEDQFTFNTI